MTRLSASKFVGTAIVCAVILVLAASPAGAKSSPRHTVGIYSDFTTKAEVHEALYHDKWPLIAAVGGLGRSDCKAPYTASHGSAGPVATELHNYSEHHSSPIYVSYWTIDEPPPGVSFYDAADAAGHHAASVLFAEYKKHAVTPRYTVADLEGYSCGRSGASDMTSKEWLTFANGWKKGIDSVGIRGCTSSCRTVPITAAAVYASQSQYSGNKLDRLHLPVFVAVSPIRGNKPTVSGSNVRGYVAYYANCSDARPDIADVKSWGRGYNTVQFVSSRVCPRS